MSFCSLRRGLSTERGASKLEYICILVVLQVGAISGIAALGQQTEKVFLPVQSTFQGGGSQTTIVQGDDPLNPTASTTELGD